MTRSNENYLRWKFGRWVAQGFIPNVILIEPDWDPHVALEPGESAIAYIVLDSDPMPILLTDLRLLRADQTLVRYDQVKSCIWIDRDNAKRARLKTSKFHRIFLELHDGRELMIEDLGQAVFPLLNFFWNKLGRREQADSQ